MAVWIDTHCHLDAPEFSLDVASVRARARENDVALCLIPAVLPEHFARVHELAHQLHDAYALGIHPLFAGQAPADALDQLAHALQRHRDDPRLVAVGEIGLDYFVPALCTESMRARQWDLYVGQLRLARQFGLPVVLHVRKSVDMVLKGLQQVSGRSASVFTGIAHAFNGSLQQAERCLAAGLKLGFGGAFTYPRATALRQLAVDLPLSAIVLETDAPDIPPSWLYATAHQRASGHPQGRNQPGEIAAIAQELALLRQMSLADLGRATVTASVAAIPKLSALMATPDIDD